MSNTAAKLEVWTANRSVFVPDKRIPPCDTYVYVPLRGHSWCLAAFDLNDRPVGFVDSRDLGYETAREWMRATNWRDQGY